MFKRICFLALFFFFSFQVVGQQNSKSLLLSYVKKDSVFIKWIPASFEEYVSVLTNGGVFSINDGNGNAFNGITNIPINTFSEIKKKETITDKNKELLAAFLSSDASDTTFRKISFAFTSIESSISKAFNEQCGFAFGLPIKNNKTLNVTLKVGELTKTVTVNCAVTSSYKEILDLNLKLDKKKTVSLTWNSTQLLSDYFGYWIERKTENGAFEKLIQEPFFLIKSNTEKEGKLAEYRDEKVEEGTTYTYRITPLNYFGIPQKMSKELKVKIPILVNASVWIDTVFAKGLERIITVKTTPLIEGKQKKITQLVLEKSASIKGVYSFVASKNVSEKDSLVKFSTKELLLSGDANYFRVTALSTDKDSLTSDPYYYFSLDQQAPKSAKNIQAIIDTNGIVKLSWEQTTDNDLLGFKVFASNSKRDEFVERTKTFAKKTFTDTLDLNNLSSQAFYYVVAVDKNYNQSPHSDTIIVEKPDTIAPVAALIEGFSIRNHATKIEWYPSPSEDVFQTVIIRSNATKVDTVFSSKVNVLEKQLFIDSALATNTAYVYQIITSDKSKNKALSEKVFITDASNGVNALKGTKAVIDKQNHFIQLSWIAPSETVFQYFIYRKLNDGGIQLYKTLDGENTSITFEDKNVKINNSYEYIIQYQNMEGKRSEKHIPLKVVY